MRCTALLFGAFAVAGPVAAQAAGSPGDERPNFLVVLMDDVDVEMIGAFREGPDLDAPQTPNIDALAEGGLRFTRAYANPICSPTRATLLTGRYSLRTGVGDVVNPEGNDRPLLLEEQILPEVLGAVGYDHSQAGKWHLGSRAAGGPRHALLSGWNWTAGTPGNLANEDAPRRQSRFGRGSRRADPDAELQTYHRWRKQTNGEDAWHEGYLTSDTTDDALARMKAMTAPWLLWVSYNAAHGPWHAPPEHMHSRPPETLRDNSAAQCVAMVESIDHEVGRLLAALDAATRSRTIVIVLSDNGGHDWAEQGPRAGRPLRRSRGATGKGTLYDAGINVPLIVNGPCLPADVRGRTCAALVNTVDLFSTIVDLAGAPPPTERVIDGVSLRPLFADPGAAVRDFAWAERFSGLFEPGQPIGRHRAMVTDGRWKLILKDQEPIEALERVETEELPRSLDELPEAVRRRLLAWATELLGSR